MHTRLVGEIYRVELAFKEAAHTSRGIYHKHVVWYPTLWRNGVVAIGECAPLPDLSAEFLRGGNDYEERLNSYYQHLETFFFKLLDLVEVETPLTAANLLSYLPELREYSSILCGFEMLLQHYEQGQVQAKQLKQAQDEGVVVLGTTSAEIEPLLWSSSFTQGKSALAINGLIWMGDHATMAKRIEQKLHDGYRCIKLKIGAIDFNDELSLLTSLRERFSPQDLELRVDANGAFAPQEAMAKLERLAALQLHSIEQPIKAGQAEALGYLCAHSPLSIGLDEELIGVNSLQDKEHLLNLIKPQYLILKPSLHGGFVGCQEWIRLAKERGIGYWVTSALESNVGLNAL